MPTYPPRRPVLEHPQPVSLLQCERPSFTRVRNSGQSYSSIYRKNPANISDSFVHVDNGTLSLVHDRNVNFFLQNMYSVLIK
jgi:hypothetical protein